jgi:hypothetical protein
MEINREVAISYTISKEVAHGNEASRFGQPPQPRSIHAGSGSWLSGVLTSAGSPTALKRVRALLQQLDRARVHRPGSGGREFRPW